MSISNVFIEAAAEAGWNRDSQLDVLLRYIENQQDDGTFEDFLRRQVDEERQLGEETNDAKDQAEGSGSGD